MNPSSPTTIKNKYDYLKIDGRHSHHMPVEAASSWTITDSRLETITISNALLPDGSWVYGYTVYWANGATSVKAPSPSLGLFHSQREAKLHAVGFMLGYIDSFIPDSQAALRRAEASLIQASLF